MLCDIHPVGEQCLISLAAHSVTYIVQWCLYLVSNIIIIDKGEKTRIKKNCTKSIAYTNVGLTFTWQLELSASIIAFHEYWDTQSGVCFCFFNQNTKLTEHIDSKLIEIQKKTWYRASKNQGKKHAQFIGILPLQTNEVCVKQLLERRTHWLNAKILKYIYHTMHKNICIKSRISA